MNETAESVWDLAVHEKDIDLEEAVKLMFRHERDELQRNCKRVFQAIRTVEIMEEFKRETE